MDNYILFSATNGVRMMNDNWAMIMIMSGMLLRPDKYSLKNYSKDHMQNITR